MNLSPSEQLCYCTIRIECTNELGNKRTGTAFIFHYKLEGSKFFPFMITNKHVVENMTVGQFKMTVADKHGNPLNNTHFPVTIPNLQSFVMPHPSIDVDLCAIPFAPVTDCATNSNVQLFYRAISQENLPTQAQLNDITAVEDIIMIGYPNGIWDSYNNMPIVRRGISATHPNFNYNGKKEFVIDAACFPGSSGSPVFIYNPSGFSDKKGIFWADKVRIFLLGILYAGPQHTATGDIKIVNIPTAHQPVAFSRIPNNLGFVIKSERILELVNVLKPYLEQKFYGFN